MADGSSGRGENIPYSEWKELGRSLRAIGISFPHILSHHPHCRWYEGDVLHLGKWRLCRGCIITYPVAAFTLIISLLVGAHRIVPWYFLLVLGVAFGSFELISLWREVGGSRYRVIKVFLGIGLALTTLGVFMTPIHLTIRILIFIQLFLIAGALASIRILKMEKKCKRCGWEGNWMRCPGFEEMNSKLESDGSLKR